MPVLTEILDGNIALVTMSGKSATQSFSMEFLPEIAAAIDSALSDKSVKGLVITGDGSFSLPELISMPLPKQSSRMRRQN